MFKITLPRRSERAVADLNELIALLQKARVLQLAFNADPFPYVVSVNFGAQVKDDELYLYIHGAREGRRFELLKSAAAVGFTAVIEDKLHLTSIPCSATNYYASVCGGAQPELLEGDEALEGLWVLMQAHGFEMPKELMQQKMAAMLPKTSVFSLKVTELSGKKHPKAAV